MLVIASRLGNGVFWYTLIAAMIVLDGYRGVTAAVHMVLVGLAGTVVYKLLKAGTLRPRPYSVQPDITVCAAPLDQFSFPSGHTLHATAFTLVAVSYYPALWPLLAPFALLVAASRVVLGLHYPSDVLAGALIGAAFAVLSTLL